MKILFWTDGFYPQIGGMETYGLQFIEAMQKKGHDFSVITQGTGEETILGISIQRFPFDLILAKQNLTKMRHIRETIEQILETFQPDLLHLNVCMGWAALAFLLLKNAFRIPIVLTVHTPFIYGQNMSSVFSSVDQICCVSDWIFREVQMRGRAVKDKARLIHNGLTLFATEPKPLIFDPPTLLLLGRCYEEKGFRIAIEAFSLLKNKGSPAELLVAGDGKGYRALQELAMRLGLKDSVRFLGEVKRIEVSSVINQSTLVIVPSYKEAFGLVALEAMQMGRPVIASNVGGLPEIVQSQETGLLVPPRDPEALCAAIEELLGSPERAREMGRKGRIWATEHFTLDQNVGQYEELYKEWV